MTSVLAIVGPTASGKTAWGLREAQRLDGEIISADSRQVYRSLRIGTAKPEGAWQETKSGRHYLVEGIPYHLVDFLDPSASFSAADFAARATPLIEEILARKRTPILVGGTGFYLKALTGGLAELPTADPSVRQELRQIADEQGRPALHAQLAAVDPDAAAKIPANNIQRVIRALEVYRLTGKPLSQWHAEHQANPPKRSFSLNYVGIDWPLETLEERITERCHAMVETGMIEETKQLLDAGTSAQSPALTGLGYPWVVQHLRGEIDRTSLITHLIQDTRRYAKRQLTWFRHQASVAWKK